MVYGCKVIHDHLGVRYSALFTNRVMRNRLWAQRNQTRQRIRIDSVRRKPALVQPNHRAQVAARAVPGHENLCRVAAVLPDILDGPRNGRGCILDVRWRLHIRVKTITRRHNGNPFVFQAIRDTAAPSGQPAAVEPDHGRKAFALWVMDINPAPRIDSLVVLWILTICDISDRCVRNLLRFLG